MVDDASPEDVGAVVEPYRRADQRVRLVRHAAHGGLSAARNTGLRQLDTELVVFLGAGDMLVGSALAKARRCLEPLCSDAAVAGVHGHVVDDSEASALVRLRARRARAPRTVVDWVAYNSSDVPFSTNAVVARRALVERSGGFDETLPEEDGDWNLWFRLLRHGYRFEPSDNAVVASRQLRPSVSNDPHRVDVTAAASLVDAAEQWAALDESLVIGRGAAAPLSRARSAHERAVRVAAMVGAEITATGSLDPLRDSDAFRALDRPALAEGRRNHLVNAAVDGACQGLGLSRPIAERLSPVARDGLERVGRAVVAEILDRPYEAANETARFDATSRHRRADVVLAAESVADVQPLLKSAATRASSLRVAAIDLEVVAGCGGANEAWLAAGVDIVPYHDVVYTIGGLAEVIVCAPTGPVVTDLLEAARRAGVSCDIVHVPGRPDALPCNPASAFDVEEVAPEDGDSRASALSTREDGSPASALGGWSGSIFPSRLPREDGPLDTASIERLANLRGRHRGELAVIIGNGPSLNETELELLADVPTFGVNAIFLARDRLPKPVTYYVVEDTMVFRDNLPAIKACEADFKLFPAMYRVSFDDSEVDEHTIFFRMNSGFYGRQTDTKCHPRFSLDATQRLYCGQSVTVINLQLAHWMGFQRVVLIGMDFSYQVPEDAERSGGRILSRSDDPNHFHPDYFGAGKTWNDPRLDRVLVSYHLADEIYQATGREIINATEGGKLDIFPRMSLREAIGSNG